jgi:hypothetical protein
VNSPCAALLITLVLAALTSLPWYVSQLMPDILVGLAVLALYLIALRRDPLGPLETLALGLVVALAIASHMGTLALCLGLLACFGLLRVAGRRIALPSPQLTAPVLPSPPACCSPRPPIIWLRANLLSRPAAPASCSGACCRTG